MNRSILAGPVAAGFCLCLAGPLAAAQSPTTDAVVQPSPSPTNPAKLKPAESCLSDLRAFDGKMEKDGYWPSGGGFGYGPMDGDPAGSTTDYRDVRPGYELRTLIASANILAQRGEQQLCEGELSTIRDIYGIYIADMRGNGMPEVDGQNTQQKQIAAAQPVTARTNAFRSDQLLGTDVRNAKNETLGSVHDLLMSPSTGAIAYLVIGRGGFFGIDEKYVPVPWGDFKATQNMSLLVLDIPKSAMDDAPQATDAQFAAPGKFDQESQKVNAYWKAQLSSN
jgi:sporulation protein YlmC with PRC-barrel domain